MVSVIYTHPVVLMMDGLIYNNHNLVSLHRGLMFACLYQSDQLAVWRIYNHISGHVDPLRQYKPLSNQRIKLESNKTVQMLIDFTDKRA